MASEIPLQKIDEYRWRIPKSYMGGMRVDGIIYANERLLEQAKSEEALQQVANVAHLPGIIKHSLAMPDLHWGYGFVIGGVAATDPEADGVVSPGGIGYDLNCLTGDTEILHQHGYTIPIGEMGSNWETTMLRCQDFQNSFETQTSLRHYLKLRPTQPVYCLKTEGGDTIKATADHPFWTPKGMIELQSLKIGDKVALSPYQGVPYEEPSDEIIVDQAQIEGLLWRLGDSHAGNQRGQVIKHLKQRDLLPLKYDSPALPYLLKILGYVMGDGDIYYVNGDGKGRISFYGKAEDLEEIRADISRLGFTPSKLHRRERVNQIKITYNTYQFSSEEISFSVSSTAFATLLVALGAPHGVKASQDYRVPQWIKGAPLWQKRLFLATLFGAELESPSTMMGSPYTIPAPKMSMIKREGYVDSGISFLRDIVDLLADFGVQIKKIGQRKELANADGFTSHQLRLVISGTNKNLIKLWGQIGFEYNIQRKTFANVALQYLKLKQRLIEDRENAAGIAVAMHADEMSISEITNKIGSKYINERFIERSVHEERQMKPRVSQAFPTFGEYLEEATPDLGKSGMIWDRIESIIPPRCCDRDSEQLEFDDYVYDFTVEHPDHNFIANGFVVSNCGVRLIRTNLDVEQLAGRTKGLVAKLFENVPCGIGSSGKIRLNSQEEKQMVEQGARWAVEREYGFFEDLQFTEANGFLSLANADAVSKRALERGKNQLGTLGSGNHFLEVQVVDRILYREAAEVMGLTEGQICVMIHSGSRGFGYQVCDEHVKTWVKVAKKYGIDLPDRQLAAAPINSKEGQDYITAMACGANYAWNNRQCIMHWVRQTFMDFFETGIDELGLELVYDVAHNIGKFEKHLVDGVERELFVHRKGATRAFPAGHPEIPDKYQKVGQPVLIPGDMGTASYVLVGNPSAMEQTWGTTCHGAGRMLSRRKAMQVTKGRSIQKDLEKQGIFVRAEGRRTLHEEVPEAYKDVDEVVRVVDGAGLSRRVARLRPIGVVKG